MTPAVQSRLNNLLYHAKKEVSEAEDELGSDSREFANYCAILLIYLTSKHLPENE